MTVIQFPGPQQFLTTAVIQQIVEDVTCIMQQNVHTGVEQHAGMTQVTFEYGVIVRSAVRHGKDGAIILMEGTNPTCPPFYDSVPVLIHNIVTLIAPLVSADYLTNKYCGVFNGEEEDNNDSA